MPLCNLNPGFRANFNPMRNIIKEGSVLKTSKALQTVMLPVIALGLQSSGHAQGNLVNLYDWTGETMYAADPNDGVIISSFNSANFFGAYSTNVLNGPDHIVPILAGSLDTTPGTTYEISYTLEETYNHSFFDGGYMKFGNDTNPCNFSDAIRNPGTDTYAATNFYDYTDIATSTTTTMSLECHLDNGDSIQVTGLSVIEVPEISAARLFGFGGCVLLLAQPWRRLSHERGRN